MVLVAQESVHAGAGRATGVVDLPIQRESHTGWPCVYGSGVKGALRSAARDSEMPSADVVFGPETANGVDHAGSLLVGDARLLLLPVRSLTGHFKLVTCPAALARLDRDLSRLGLGRPQRRSVPKIEQGHVLVPTGEGDLFLEELRFTSRSGGLDDLVEEIARLVYAGDSDFVAARLAIVTDDDFAYLATYATPVRAHVRLEESTKTVQAGALWYEESLPPDTVLYSLVSATPSRKSGTQLTGDEVLELLKQTLTDRPYLQLGGNETTGMGWCRVHLTESSGV